MKKKSTCVHFITFVSFLIIFLVPKFSHGYCDPQCVPWARENSKIKLNALPPTYYANTLPEAAKRSGKYKLSDKPKKGCIIILDTPNQEDHVIAVEDSDEKKDNEYSLRITHANYSYKKSGVCDSESNVKATYDKKKRMLKFRSGAWDGKKIPVLAIIVPK